MKCQKCGADIKDNMKFCNKCGAKVVGEEQPKPVIEQPKIEHTPTQFEKVNSENEAPKTAANAVESTNQQIQQTVIQQNPNVAMNYQQTVNNTTTPIAPQYYVPNTTPNQIVTKKSKNNIVAGVLALFLGHIGVQWFYLGNPLRGILYILIAIACPIIYPPLLAIFMVFYIGEAIFFFCSKKETFEKYVNWKLIKKK